MEVVIWSTCKSSAGYRRIGGDGGVMEELPK